MRRYHISPIFQLAALIWVAFSVCVYFLQVSFNVANCHLSNFCLSIGNTNFQIESAVNHRYFLRAFLTSIGLGPDKSHVPGPIWFILGGVFFLYVANVIYEVVAERKKELNINLTPFHLVLILSGIFSIIYYRWISFYQLDAPIKYPGIFVHYLTELGIILGTCLVAVSIGKRIKVFLERGAESNDYLREFLFSIALGLMVLILGFYFLGLVGYFNFLFVLGFLAILTLLSWREVYFWIKTFFAKKFSLRINYFSSFVFLAIFSLIFMAQSLVQLIRTGPIGFDDLNVYINNAHLMAVSGKLISGGMSYYWELFSGLGFVLFGTATSALIICSIGGILSFLIVYYFIRNYCKKRSFSEGQTRFYAMLASTIWFTLPMVVFPSVLDMKVDLAGMFFALMAFVSFSEWKDGGIGWRGRNSALYLSAFLVGFATAVKYTNVLMLVVLVVYLIWTIYIRSGVRIKQYWIALLFVAISLMPILPVSLRNIYQTQSIAIADIRFGERESNKIKAEPAFSTDSGIISNFDQYIREKRVAEIEVNRYIGYDKGIIKYLLLPFRITSNSLVYGPFINIGYLFLAFLPLGLLFAFQKRKNLVKASYLRDIAILGTIFWLLWAVTASGIVWYGFAGFGFLLIMLIEIYHQIRQSFSRLAVILINAVIILWFFLAILLRLTFLPSDNIAIDRDELRFARGEITASDDQSAKFQPYLKIINQINQDILAYPDNPPKVYLAGTFYRYFIINNDRTVCNDPMYDAFAYAYQDKDDTKTLERFKNSGIKYMVISRWMGGVDRSPDQRLVKQNTEFLDFIERNADHFYLLSDPHDDKIMIIQLYD